MNQESKDVRRGREGGLLAVHLYNAASVASASSSKEDGHWILVGSLSYLSNVALFMCGIL
jgi:hypothetical protein